MESSNKVKYKSNYLTKVIFKLDFSSLEDYGVVKLKEFQKLMKNKFPIVQESRIPTIDFKIGENANFETKNSEEIRWDFIDRNNSMALIIDRGSLALEISVYKDFEEFFEIVDLIISSFFKVFHSVMSTRLGLRYINEIRIDGEDPLEWGDYIHHDLIKTNSFFEAKNKIIKSISSIEMREDDFNVRFQFGMPNSLYPNKIIKKEFVLDYDCYTTDSLEKEEIIEKVKLFNSVITDLFEKSVKDGLRSKMEVIKEDD